MKDVSTTNQHHWIANSEIVIGVIVNSTDCTAMSERHCGRFDFLAIIESDYEIYIVHFWQATLIVIVYIMIDMIAMIGATFKFRKFRYVRNLLGSAGGRMKVQ